MLRIGSRANSMIGYLGNSYLKGRMTRWWLKLQLSLINQDKETSGQFCGLDDIPAFVCVHTIMEWPWFVLIRLCHRVSVKPFVSAGDPTALLCGPGRLWARRLLLSQAES